MTSKTEMLLNIKQVSFPQGLVGISEWKNFSLHQTTDMVPIALLISSDEKRVSFIVSNPASWFPNYRFDLSDADMEEIKATSIDDLIILSIINIESDPFKVTANMAAPIVINPESKLGLQVLLHDSPYLPRQPLSMKTMAVKLDNGLLGLPEYKNFVMQIIDELMPVMLLVCKDEEHISFPVVNPWLVDPNYDPKLDKDELRELFATSQEELAWFAIMNVKNEENQPIEITVNLKAPVVVNPRNGSAKQVILSKTEYEVMKPIHMADVSKMGLDPSKIV
jgi:flagellar assembly factor FliW